MLTRVMAILIWLAETPWSEPGGDTQPLPPAAAAVVACALLPLAVVVLVTAPVGSTRGTAGTASWRPPRGPPVGGGGGGGGGGAGGDGRRPGAADGHLLGAEVAGHDGRVVADLFRRPLSDDLPRVHGVHAVT